MKNIIFLGLLCVLFCPVSGCAQADDTSRSWNQPVKPFRIAGNLYYVGASDLSSFLIVTPQGHILLDSGLVETVPQIQKNVVQLGFRLEDVKVLINTHAHYDHAGGLALLKRLTKATLMASEADAALMAAGGKGDPNFGDKLAYEPVKADRILHDGDKVELGGVTMTARLTPGHTKGNTTWTMTVDDGSKRYNVVVVGSTSFPGYKLVDNPNYPGIVGDYQRTFQILKGLPCDIFLAPHGSFYELTKKSKLLEEGTKQNPFIDPYGYKRYVEENEQAFNKELERQRK